MGDIPYREGDPTYEPPKMALESFKNEVAPEDLRMWAVKQAILFLSVPGTSGNVILMAESIEKYVREGTV